VLELFHNLWRGKVDNRPEFASEEPVVEETIQEPLADRINDDIVLTTPKGKSITVG
jgi:hypothetical protein